MKKIKSFRLLIQIVILIIIIILGYLHQVKGGGASGSPSADALCVFGGAETLYSYITKGVLLNRIELSSLVFFLITIAVTLIFGRLFCSFVCPLGTLQDLGSKIKIKKLKVPHKLHRGLSYLKYAVLIVVLYLTYSAGSLVIRSYDPYAAFMHLTSAEVLTDFSIGIALLVLIVVASLFIERFFCRYLCPLGAIFSIVNKIRPFKVRREHTCISCGKCTRNCPMGIDIMSKDIVRDGDCISCLSCTDCPVKAVSIKSRKITLSNKKLIASSLIAAVLIFAGFYTTGNFKTYTGASEAINQGGEVNTENIKGYMTLEEISKALNIKIEKLYELLDIPSSISPKTPIKDVKNTITNFSVEDARDILAEYLKNN